MNTEENQWLKALGREELYFRHQLSHQQIDDLLGDQGSRGFREAKAQMLAKLNVFLGVSRLLTEAGIAFIPLKGFLLSQRIYGDPSYRITGDFDLLIKPQKVSEAIRVLLKNGYQPEAFTLPQDKACQRRVLRMINECSLVHKETGINIELHWRLFGSDLVSTKTLDAIIDDKLEETQLAGQAFRQFNPEIELLYLVVHGGFHAYRRLKWLVDIKTYLERVRFDEARFLELAKSLNAFRLIALTNALLEHFFPGSRLLPSSQPPRKPPFRFCLQEIHTTTEEETKSIRIYLQRLHFALDAFPRWRYKLSVIKNNLLATDSINSKYIPCIPLLYYLIGPFWKLFRGFR
ncbi:MAG: nucleotidyltransferase family protein [Bacteroides sp.]|jgi:hypothetical protein|nr:nucleotidyltransferase family protein [Bacteroides sp.]